MLLQKKSEFYSFNSLTVNAKQPHIDHSFSDNFEYIRILCKFPRKALVPTTELLPGRSIQQFSDLACLH